MKKIFTLLFTLLMLFTVCGCSDDNTNDNSAKAPVIINVPSDYEQADSSEKSNSSVIESTADIPSISTEQSVQVENQSYSYCGNKNSKKFHKSTCGALKNTKDENKVYFKNRSDYINQGYVPCKKCNP